MQNFYSILSQAFIIKHKTIILLFLSIAFGFLIRVIYLDRVPVGITNDELDFAINSKAVFLTGKDIAQVWNPLSLTTITGEFPRAELPYILLAPFIGPLPVSLFSARLPYALAGTGIILLLSLITWKLVGKKPALFVAAVGAINPWSIFFSRTAFEVPLAILLFLLGFYLLLIIKGWKTLFAIIPFFLGFYCYMGTKLIFIPMTLIFLIYSWKVIHKGKFTVQYISLFVLCVLTFITFLIRYNHSAAQIRAGNELYTPFTNTVNTRVQNDRKLSIHTPLTSLYSNKLTDYAIGAVEKYLKAFSPSLLFTNGDSEVHQSLFYHGNFYYIDIFFILFGFCYLFTHNKKVFLLILSLILISPLPSVASNANVSYSLRSALMFPLLIILSGLGIYCVVSTLFFQKHKSILSIALIGIYLILFTSFINIYFFRYPIYNSEATNFSVRILARFIFNEVANRKVYVISSGPEDLFSQYIFYNNLYNSNTKDKIAQIYRKLHQNNGNHILTFGNLTLTNCPSSPLTISDATVIMDANANCKNAQIKKPSSSLTQNILHIGSLDDGRGIYQIYNTHYCGNTSLDSYPHDITFSDLNVEKISDERFCKKFISS